MFSLSHTTGYAIKALTCIAGNRDLMQIRDIAKCTGIPAPYLSKVILRLCKSGILTSKRGHKGGVWLTRKADEISLYEISEAVEGGDPFTACLLGLETCSDERACPNHAFWKGSRDRIRRQLEKTSLADVLIFENKRLDEGCSGSQLLPSARSSNRRDNEYLI